MPGPQADLCMVIHKKAGQADRSMDYTAALAPRSTIRYNDFADHHYAFIVLEEMVSGPVPGRTFNRATTRRGIALRFDH